MSSLRAAPTPFLSPTVLHATNPESGNAPGEVAKGRLSNVAASVLMKLLYGARVALWDLVRAICAIASFITKWTAYTGSSATCTRRSASSW